jgi:hypothetical protein
LPPEPQANGRRNIAATPPSINDGCH